MSRLSAASLRINESLDFDQVLQGALDSARSLTGARVGVIPCWMRGTGAELPLLGLTAGEDRQLGSHRRAGVFQALTGITEPVRIPDVVEYVRSLGFAGFSIPVPVDRACSFMAAPVFHRDARVGHVFVGDKEDGEEFTVADQETLVMFAAQAPWSSPTPVPTGRSGGPGPTWRPWSTPRRWAWRCLTLRPGRCCRSTWKSSAS